ncbi:hypothetical protein RvY_01849 [Ramazzottius varieornatus]|uniref:Uncharacterized protein n=1 Tax=Ramazzottius varieornatus TaxID=947166 RepID=A0A1D1USE9_RAMVA|nr:hypothetical protein RvY_01849 [Ramazzottius varieornatus]
MTVQGCSFRRVSPDRVDAYTGTHLHVPFAGPQDWTSSMTGDLLAEVDSQDEDTDGEDSDVNDLDEPGAERAEADEEVEARQEELDGSDARGRNTPDK